MSNLIVPAIGSLSEYYGRKNATPYYKARARQGAGPSSIKGDSLYISAEGFALLAASRKEGGLNH